MIKILRLDQWSKNLVIFLPAFLSKEISLLLDIKLIGFFVSFSLIISATYIWNDIKDADQDKLHPEKKRRPIASGEMAVNFAYKYSFFLILISNVYIIVFYNHILIYIFSYILLTYLYTNFFKYKKYFDIFSITFLFAIRIYLGSILTNTKLTGFLIIFLLLVLTQIAIGKKLSILNDNSIEESSKIKFFLLENYTPNELRKLLISFSILSIFTLILWSYSKTTFIEFDWLYSLALVLTFFIFILKFVKDTWVSRTENFINWVIVYRKYYYLLFMFVLIIIILYF